MRGILVSLTRTSTLESRAVATLSALALSCGSTPDQAPAAVSDWDEVRGAYENLLALAGKGERDSGNDWLATFEGGPAISAELSRPHMAMADGKGNVYIADKEAHAIRRVGVDGRIVTVAGTNVAGDDGDQAAPATTRRLSNPNGLYVREDGTLYVVDLDNGKIRKITPDGVMTTLFVVEDGISTGRGLYVSPDESEVYFASGNVVRRWTPVDGVRDWATGFVNLGMVVKDGKGRFLAADRGASMVYAIDTRGARVPVAGNGASEGSGEGEPAIATSMRGARAVWPRSSGGFFVGTHEGCQIWYVDSVGVAHLFVDGAPDAHRGDGDPYDSPGKKVSELRSVTLDANENLIIVENDVGRVRVVRRK
jgi:hypothetical protein